MLLLFINLFFFVGTSSRCLWEQCMTPNGYCVDHCAFKKGLTCCEGNWQRDCNHPECLPSCAKDTCLSPNGSCRPHGFYFPPKEKLCCFGEWLFGKGKVCGCHRNDCLSPNGDCRPHGFYFPPKAKLCCFGEWLYDKGTIC